MKTTAFQLLTVVHGPLFLRPFTGGLLLAHLLLGDVGLCLLALTISLCSVGKQHLHLVLQHVTFCTGSAPAPPAPGRKRLIVQRCSSFLQLSDLG